MAGPCSTSPQCRWTDERVRHDCFVTQGSCPPECSFVASQGCPGFLLHCCYDDRNRGAHGEGRAQHLKGVTGITYLYRLASHQDGLPWCEHTHSVLSPLMCRPSSVKRCSTFSICCCRKERDSAQRQVSSMYILPLKGREVSPSSLRARISPMDSPMSAAKRTGESGDPCLTPLFVGLECYLRLSAPTTFRIAPVVATIWLPRVCPLRLQVSGTEVPPV